MTVITDSKKQQWALMIASARPSDLAKLRQDIYKEVKEELEPRSTNNSACSLIIDLAGGIKALVSVWSDAIMIGINGDHSITHRAFPLHSMVLREYEISITVRLNKDRFGYICYQPYHSAHIYRRYGVYQWLEVYSEIPTRKKHLNKQAIIPKMGQQLVGELVALMYKGVDFHVQNNNKQYEITVKRLIAWFRELKVKTALSDEEIEQLHLKVHGKDVKGSFFRTTDMTSLLQWAEEIAEMICVDGNRPYLIDTLTK